MYITVHRAGSPLSVKPLIGHCIATSPQISSFKVCNGHVIGRAAPPGWSSYRCQQRPPFLYNPPSRPPAPGLRGMPPPRERRRRASLAPSPATTPSRPATSSPASTAPSSIRFVPVRPHSFRSRLYRSSPSSSPERPAMPSSAGSRPGSHPAMPDSSPSSPSPPPSSSSPTPVLSRGCRPAPA